MTNKSLNLASTRTKVIIAIAATIEIALVGVAHADISRRKPSELNGSKLQWRAITLITFLGPIVYFLRGRR